MRENDWEFLVCDESGVQLTEMRGPEKVQGKLCVLALPGAKFNIKVSHIWEREREKERRKGHFRMLFTLLCQPRLYSVPPSFTGLLFWSRDILLQPLY